MASTAPKTSKWISPSSQIHYCHKCEGLIDYLIRSFHEKYLDTSLELTERSPEEYLLDVKDVILGSKRCCLCAFIFTIWKTWFIGDRIYSKPVAEDSVYPLEGTIIVGTHGLHVSFKCKQFEKLNDEVSVHSHPGYSSYGHFVTDSTDSDECWSLASKWLKTCRLEHNCHTPIQTTLPTRLIEISRTSNEFTLRLVNSSSLEGVEYCTLSHCWGTLPFLKLLPGNHKEFEKSIPYELLSQTFRDAIYAACKLGFKYIWIDSLCIIQNDEEDWGRESGCMSNVYIGSSLNLAASSGINCDSGLFHSRNPVAVLPCIIKFPGDEAPHALIFNEETWAGVERSPLSSRAWVSQERFLSRRTLFFAADQIFWECLAGTACETQPWDPHLGLQCFSGNSFQWRSTYSYRAWTDVIYDYSLSLLTFESDKLVAISGVARYMSESGLGDYVAGLWRNDMELQLLWNSKVDYFYKSEGGYLPSEYRAPSWSWAAIEGTEICLPGTLEDTHYCFLNSHMCYTTNIRVLDVFVEPKVDTDVFGGVNFASLKIQCPQLKKLPTLKRNVKSEILELFTGNECIHVYLDVEETEKDLTGDLLLFRAMTFRGVKKSKDCVGMTGLLLQRSELGPGHYKRIGRFWIDNYPSPRVYQLEWGLEDGIERRVDTQEGSMGGLGNENKNEKEAVKIDEVEGHVDDGKEEDGQDDKDETGSNNGNSGIVRDKVKKNNKDEDEKDEIENIKKNEVRKENIEDKAERNNMKDDKDEKRSSDKAEDVQESDESNEKLQHAVYHSSLWTKLEDEKMHEQASISLHDISISGEEDEEQFIITLV